jgi:hypothetical protein
MGNENRERSRGLLFALVSQSPPPAKYIVGREVCGTLSNPPNSAKRRIFWKFSRIPRPGIFPV